jgi:hypothetical protein
MGDLELYGKIKCDLREKNYFYAWRIFLVTGNALSVICGMVILLYTPLL